MKTRILRRISVAVLAVCALGVGLPAVLDAEVGANTTPKTVLVVPVKEEIGVKTLFLFRRALKEAEQRGADAIVIDMDTWGGAVDDTEKIMQLLSRTNVATYTFINSKAISGGSYIAVATKHIYMAPAATIGASTAVTGLPTADESEDIRNKRMAAMKGLMRGAAEQNGHRAEVFEKMVDPNMELTVDGKKIRGKGELLVLTATEAEQLYGTPPKSLLSEGTVKNVDELLQKAGLGGAEVVQIRLTGFEHFARFIGSISVILIVLGLLGIYVEFHTQGTIIPGALAAVCFGLVFFGSYLSGLAGWEHLLLLMLGVGLLALEIFVIPGFGVTGVAGIICIVLSLLLMLTERMPGGSWFPTWSELQMPILKLSLSFVVAVAGMVVLAKYLPKTQMWKRLELSPAAVTAPDQPTDFTPSALVGMVGVAQTMLRPAGKALIDGKLIDVVTQGDLIDKGQSVKVIEAAGARIVVAKM